MSCRGMPWLGCVDCCTHRLIDSAGTLYWSENADDIGVCERCRKVVIGIAYSGSTYYLLLWGMDGVNQFNVVQAWTSAGEFLWETDLVGNDDANTSGRITTDGTDIWVGLLTTSLKVWRIDCTDGTIQDDSAFSVTSNGLTASGDGEVYIAHGWLDDGDGAGLVSKWLDGVVSQRFGAAPCSGSPVAHSIALSGSSVIVGHGMYQTDDFEVQGCCTYGFVSRYDSQVLKWISPYDLSDEIDDLEPPIVKVVGDTIYWAIRGTMFYGTMSIEDGQVTQPNVLDFPSPGDCNSNASIQDMDASDGYFWLAACQWAVVSDVDGAIVASSPHLNAADYEGSFIEDNLVRAIAADGDGNALFGGVGAPCVPPELDDVTAHTASCADVVECDPHEWCHPADCGIIATNGRIAIEECERDQWPPCGGSVFVRGAGCLEFEETRPLTGAGCEDGVWSWAAVSAVECAASVPRWELGIYYECGVGPSVTFKFAGEEATVTDVTLVCDGPMGYAAIYWNWTIEDGGECCSGSMSGCGAMNDEECSIANCTECPDGAPAIYSADMSGFDQGAGSCADCSSITNVNLAFVSNVMGDCTWEGELTFCSEVLTVRLKMMSGAVSIDVLNGGGTVQATYTADDDPFDCLAGGAFTQSFLSYTGTECTVWPTTISITAA